YLGVEVAGKPLVARLDAIVDGLSFGKSMVWEPGGRRFSRPIRWLCAKLDEETLRGGITYGHRFVAGRVEVPSADAYADVLRAARVEPDAAERRRRIVQGLPVGWSDPLGKLDEVVFLVEWPEVLEGSFDERFLQLPSRVVERSEERRVGK